MAESAAPVCVHTGKAPSDLRSRLEAYSFVLVLSKADRSLKAVLDHERIQEDPDRVRIAAKHFAEALRHLHEEGVIHGDFKPLNGVRVEGASDTRELRQQRPSLSTTG